MGVSYTFFTRAFETPVDIIDAETKMFKTTYIKEYKPHGLSAILLVNPLALGNESLNSSTGSNIGVGIGKRWAGSFAAYVTMDVIGIRQPRTAFVDVYGGGKAAFTIDKQIQYQFDTNDENLFRTKQYGVLGFKLSYSLDVFNNFRKKAQEKEAQLKENETQSDKAKKQLIALQAKC